MKSWFLVVFSMAVLCPALWAQDAPSAIDQSRFFQRTPESPIPPAVDENGNAVPVTQNRDDDSFGAQMILKDQLRERPFILSAGASLYYTNNVALTRRDTRDDVFAVINATGTWSRRLSPELETTVGLQAAIFRYDRSSQLDFNNLGAGLGLAWTPRRWSGVSMFGRYDFTELIDRHGRELLRDHQFSIGAQKAFVLGRSHAATLGTVGSIGISEPSAAERNQVGLFAGYRLLLTRSLETELMYRIAYQSYSDSSRHDFNQVLSWSLRYRLAEWAEATAFFSFGDNRSNTAAFDYDVLSNGGGFGLTTRF